MKTATETRIPWADRRKIRADALTAMTMRVIERYLDSSPEAREHNVRRLAANALFELFYVAGAEVITDLDRANAGLPPRNDEGYAERELQILEAHREQALMQPLVASVPFPIKS